MTTPVESIENPHDFKVFCDALLRFELGSLVQTYASDGKDGGIDAEYTGAIDGVQGRWVFQYKFSDPREATSKRRQSVLGKYRGDKSEFDKVGVKNACGYLLLTNVPASVAMVDELRGSWQSRQPNTPFVVWDPSSLNAMLKGREHLARSWSGVREERCRQAIIFPLWKWLAEARSAAASWSENAVWPLDVASSFEQSPLPAFRAHYESRYRLRFKSSLEALAPQLADPQFAHAETVAFPHAMKPLFEVRRAVSSLQAAIEAEIKVLGSDLLARVPHLDDVDESEREMGAMALAYCLLEVRWGYAVHALHSVRDGVLIVRARTAAWTKPVRDGLEPVLDQLVAGAKRGDPPAAVKDARRDVSKCLEEWHAALWPVVNLGVDADAQLRP